MVKAAINPARLFGFENRWFCQQFEVLCEIQRNISNCKRRSSNLVKALIVHTRFLLVQKGWFVNSLRCCVKFRLLQRFRVDELKIWLPPVCM